MTTLSLSEALNGYKADSKKWGPQVRNDEVQNLMPKPLKGENLTALCRKYNTGTGPMLTQLKAPLLNDELLQILPSSCTARDTRLRAKQKLLGHAMMAIGKVMTAALNNFKYSDAVLNALKDAANLIADVHAAETATRRRLVTTLLNTKFIKSRGPKLPAGTYLFGETKDIIPNGFVEAVAPLISCASGCLVGSQLHGQVLEANASKSPCPKAFGYLCRGPCEPKAKQWSGPAYRGPAWCAKGVCTPPYRGMRARWRPSTLGKLGTRTPKQLQDASVYKDTSSSEETSDSRIVKKDKDNIYY